MLRRGYAFSLLTLSFISVVGLLATGHQISFGDFVQLKFILEAGLFFLTGFSMLRNQLGASLIVLLILTQLSLTDIYVDVIRESSSIGITFLFIVVTGLTIFHIWDRVKVLRQGA
jgi:hypothetical protein